jgi:O-antigen/teichoic acid export membrane protein
MTLRRHIVKGAAVLSVGQGVGQILAFVRNVVVARLLSPHDVGVAATLAVTLSLADLLADLSIDKLLIQAENGDEPRMRATAQFFSVCRGMTQAACLFLLSWPVARLFPIAGGDVGLPMRRDRALIGALPIWMCSALSGI